MPVRKADAKPVDVYAGGGKKKMFDLKHKMYAFIRDEKRFRFEPRKTVGRFP